MNNSNQENNYVDSRTPEERESEIKTMFTTSQEKKCEHDVVAKYCFRCKRPDLAGTPPQHEEWIVRFEKEFTKEHFQYDGQLEYDLYQEVKDFISSLLNQERDKEYLHGLEMGLKEGYKDGLRTAIEHAKVINTTDTNVVDLQEPNK